MKLASIVINDSLELAIISSQGAIPITQLIADFDVPQAWDTDFKSFIAHYLQDAVAWYNTNKIELERIKAIPPSQANFAPLYTNPGKIWGIGLNYADHAADLDEGTPDKYPGSFMRPATTIIGYGDMIELPQLSTGTTGEGELGIIIGSDAKDIPRDSWLDVVAGFTTIIDMTAEDILRHNPRYLTLSKSFDTYFSFGPVMITADEFSTEDILDLEVCTVFNGSIHARNVVRNMRYPPDYLVSFHSRVMTLQPGDIISTGTPRAKKIEHGDTIGAYVSGFYSLQNPVNRSDPQA